LMQRTFQNAASVPHPQMGLYRNWREKDRFLYGVVDVANGQVVLVTTEGLSGARRLAQSITSQKRTRTKRERLLGRSWLPMSGRAAPTIAQDRQPPQTGRRRPRTINPGAGRHESPFRGAQGGAPAASRKCGAATTSANKSPDMPPGPRSPIAALNLVGEGSLHQPGPGAYHQVGCRSYR
jgi:hypothetical protein